MGFLLSVGEWREGDGGYFGDFMNKKGSWEKYLKNSTASNKPWNIS